MTSGFYDRLRAKRKDDVALAGCIKNVVDKLGEVETDSDKPGMLLGKIQSGKTRGFVGSIALAFDSGYDVAIVLTKGTKTLSAQTVSRLETDFAEFIENDEMIVLDIMHLPGKLAGSELSRKIVIVAKKQSHNLDYLVSMFEDYDVLLSKKVLLIDDEADLASIRFVKNREADVIEQGKIAEKMDAFRDKIDDVSFLQVTATPYSLYLQPEDYEDGNEDFVFKPKKPAFTELLPIHGGYVGGDDYFGEFDETDPRFYLYSEVFSNELDTLREKDLRRVKKEKVLSSDNTKALRTSIVNFILAVCLRRAQQQKLELKLRKYSMVIHIDTKKAAHKWQDELIQWIFDRIKKQAQQSPDQLKSIFDDAYNDLKRSVTAHGDWMPTRKNLFKSFLGAFLNDDIVWERVNSDNDVLALLDQDAELKLRTPFNIFVGGNILDRGITIPNLISFYYGRNPKTMQADTVLQHSRMYGNRDRSDLAVTRFYTSQSVYDRLYTINQFENALRSAFETGAHDAGVVFIQQNANQQIRPCAPNKLLLSKVNAVRPSGLLLPTGFQTVVKPKLSKLVKSIDDILDLDARVPEQFHEMSLNDAKSIVNLIAKSCKFEGPKFEWDAMKGLIDYFDQASESNDGQVLVISSLNRSLDRLKSGDKSGRSILGTALRSRMAQEHTDRTKLALLRQTGTKALNWNGGPFWWPVLCAPDSIEPCVFASKTIG